MSDYISRVDAVPQMEHDREWIIGCIKHDGFIKTDRFDKANQIILEALEPTKPSDLISRADAIKAIKDLHGGCITDNVKNITEYVLLGVPSVSADIVRCKDCRHANECHKSVQYTRNEPRTVTIGYSPIEWCSHGERKEE